MSVWTDARDNVRHGLVAMWTSMSPPARSFCWGMAIGLLSGGVIVGLLAW